MHYIVYIQRVCVSRPSKTGFSIRIMCNTALIIGPPLRTWLLIYYPNCHFGGQIRTN